jgi:hypothetical protein
VPVYQSRHPQVCAYISELVGAIARELELGKVKRVTIVIKTVDTGLPLERFIVDMGYLAMDKVKERHHREAPCVVSSCPSTPPLFRSRRSGSIVPTRSWQAARRTECRRAELDAQRLPHQAHGPRLAIGRDKG